MQIEMQKQNVFYQTPLTSWRVHLPVGDPEGLGAKTSLTSSSFL